MSPHTVSLSSGALPVADMGRIGSFRYVMALILKMGHCLDSREYMTVVLGHQYFARCLRVGDGPFKDDFWISWHEDVAHLALDHLEGTPSKYPDKVRLVGTLGQRHTADHDGGRWHIETQHNRNILSLVLTHPSDSPGVLPWDYGSNEGSGVVLIGHAASDTPVHSRSIGTLDNVHSTGLQGSLTVIPV